MSNKAKNLKTDTMPQAFHAILAACEPPVRVKIRPGRSRGRRIVEFTLTKSQRDQMFNDPFGRIFGEFYKTLPSVFANLSRKTGKP